jgi:transposase InsO family protein
VQRQAVIEAYPCLVVAWSIGGPLRSKLVVDAMEMARRRRKPAPKTIVRSNRDAKYTSWIFGHRLRQVGPLGPMGKVASGVGKALIESFCSSMQAELLDRRFWTSRVQFGGAMFEWIKCWYSPERQRSSLKMVSPAHFEQLDNNPMVTTR